MAIQTVIVQAYILYMTTQVAVAIPPFSLGILRPEMAPQILHHLKLEVDHNIKNGLDGRGENEHICDRFWENHAISAIILYQIKELDNDT